MEKSEINDTENYLNRIMLQNLMLMRFIVMICCSFTLIGVMLCVYSVTMTIAKPLKKLIKFANIINSNATEKNFLSDTQNELASLPAVFFFINLSIKRTVAAGLICFELLIK